MPSTDYEPGATVLVPGADSAAMDATGAGNYADPTSPSTAPGADSAKVVSRNVAPSIGHDQTDAAALAGALEAKGALP